MADFVLSLKSVGGSHGPKVESRWLPGVTLELIKLSEVNKDRPRPHLLKLAAL